MAKRLLAVLAGTLIAAASVAVSPRADARPLERHFGMGNSCYGRIYSDEHLKRHNGQQVREIRFDHFPTAHGAYDDDGNIAFDPDKAEIYFVVTVRFRDSDKIYTDSGICFPAGEQYRCQIECDGGRFNLQDRSATSILLLNRTGFSVSGCGAEDFRELDPEPDDKVFRLNRQPAESCVPPRRP